MPWTIADVDSHKKGLSKAQKKQWAKVANAILSRCEKDGGKDCDAMAIRIANSRIGK